MSEAIAHLQITTGAAPVQIEGELPDGNYLYFRARGDAWELTIASDEEKLFSDEVLFYQTETYGTGFDASWMPHPIAWEIVTKGLQEYEIQS
ncbi:MAG: hypothetical protein LRZ84_14705 [Desertifilum sp.]|nr:hypothetical protein [Desertifilum sp.]